jgi:hypothetical protein
MIERAVYSLWTSPIEGEHVGFNTEEALFDCFKLSLYYTKQWFKEVHLVTDIKGKALIKKHGLKFDKIDIGLEESLKGIDKIHWALGKIYACKIQDKPFIHIDNDVIWFKKPPLKILTAEAAFQNTECKSLINWYSLLLNDAQDNYKNKPEWFNCKDFKAYNCGIIAFNKLDFLSEWWEEALKYISYLRDDCFVEYGQEITSLIFEQFAVYHLCKYYNYDVRVLSLKTHITEEVAIELGYTHLISGSKRDHKVELKVKNRLKQIINLV